MRTPKSQKSKELKIFAELLRGHLVDGTGNRDQNPWTDAKFAEKLASGNKRPASISDRTVSNWRTGQVLPSKIEPILTALFGARDTRLNNQAAEQLREAYKAAFAAERHGEGTSIQPVEPDWNTVDGNPSADLQLYWILEDERPTISPAAKLTPHNRRSRLVGRDEELHELRTWIESDYPISVRLIVGRPGIGKTRLAIELAKSLEGWKTGFLRNEELKSFLAHRTCKNWSPARSTLIIVDGASSMSNALGSFMAMLADRSEGNKNCPKIRILLIEREANIDHGWYCEVFGYNNLESNQRRRIRHPQNPVEIQGVNKIDALDIISSCQSMYAPTSKCITEPEIIFEKLRRADEGDYLAFNPLMLQIAASGGVPEAAPAERLSAFTLLDFVVARERDRMADEWMRCEGPEIVLPYVFKIISMINIMKSAKLETLVQIIDSTPELNVLSRIANHEKMFHFISRVLPISNGEIFRAIEPDLVAELFVARVGRTISSDLMMNLFSIYPISVGRSLWRIVRDFGDAEPVAGVVSEWILGIGNSITSNSASLDAFIKDAGDAHQSNLGASLLAALYRKATEALQNGGDTCETLLTGPEDRNGIIARFLMREAYVLIINQHHREALAKLKEADSLLNWSDSTQDVEDKLYFTDLEISCYKALSNSDKLKIALERGVAVCESQITSGNFFPSKNAELSALSYISSGRSGKFSLITERGLDIIIDGSSILDTRIKQANYIDHLIRIGSFPRDLTFISMQNCKSALMDDSCEFFAKAATIYKEAINNIKSDDPAFVASGLTKKYKTLLDISSSYKPIALHHFLNLGTFVISSTDSDNERRNIVHEVVSVFFYAIDEKVPVAGRHLANLMLCLMLPASAQIRTDGVLLLSDEDVKKMRDNNFKPESLKKVMTFIDKCIDALGIDFERRLSSEKGTMRLATPSEELRFQS